MTQTIVDTSGLTDSRNFLIQYLRDAGYTGSTEDGTAIHDTVIKPVALLFYVFQQQVEKSKAYLSLAAAEGLKDTLGDEYDTIVDSILSNWFVERKDGQPPKIQVRLYFSRPVGIIQFSPTQTIATINSIQFSPIETSSVVTTDFIGHLNPFGGTEKYSVDLVLQGNTTTVMSSDFNVLVPTFSLSVPYFISGEILSVLQVGSTIEDSEDFINRTKQVITTRELISDRAIRTVLPDSIPEVLDVYVAGYGDSEQMRDIHTFQGVTVHTGNKVDLYVKTRVERVTKSIIVDSGGMLSLVGIPVLRVFGVTDSEGESVDFTQYGYTETEFGSMESGLYLGVSGFSTGDIYTVEILMSQALSLPTDFITHDDNRVGCYDPLVKEMYPIVMSATIYVTLDPESLLTQTATLAASRIQATAVAFIMSLGSQDVFRVSALITHLHNTHSEITQVSTPMTWVHELVDPATMEVVTGSTVSTFILPIGMSQQVTNNTTQYYSDTTLITVVAQ